MAKNIEECISIQKHTTSAKQLLVSKPPYQVVNELPTSLADPYVQAGYPDQRSAAGSILSHVVNLPEQSIRPISLQYQQENIQKQDKHLTQLNNNAKGESQQEVKQEQDSAQAVAEISKAIEAMYTNENKTGVSDVSNMISDEIAKYSKDIDPIKEQLLKSGQFCCTIKYVTFVWYLIDTYFNHSAEVYYYNQGDKLVPAPNEVVYQQFISFINKDMNNLTESVKNLKLDQNVDDLKKTINQQMSDLKSILRPIDSFVSSTSYLYSISDQVMKNISKLQPNSFLDVLDTFMTMMMMSQLSILIDVQNKYIKENIEKFVNDVNKQQQAAYNGNKQNFFIDSLLLTHKNMDMYRYMFVKYFNNEQFDAQYKQSKSPQQVIMQQVSNIGGNLVNSLFTMNSENVYKQIVNVLETLYSAQDQNKVNINFSSDIIKQQDINSQMQDATYNQFNDKDVNKLAQSILNQFGFVNTSEVSYVYQTFQTFFTVFSDAFTGNWQNIGTNLNNQIANMESTYQKQSDKSTQSISTILGTVLNQVVQTYMQYLTQLISKTYEFDKDMWNNLSPYIYSKYQYDEKTSTPAEIKKCLYMQAAQDQLSNYIQGFAKPGTAEQKCGNIFEQVYQILIWLDPVSYVPVLNMLADYIMKSIYTLLFRMLQDIQTNQYDIAIKGESINLHLVDTADDVTNVMMQQLDLLKNLLKTENLELLTKCISTSDIKSLTPTEEELKAIDKLDQPLNTIIKTMIDFMQKILNL